MRQFKPLPADLELGDTLARRVFTLREFRNLTRRDLSKYSRLKEDRIEDIETGIETWLSVADRQMLAKALAVEPILLQEVESRPDLGANRMYQADIEIGKRILDGARNLECPSCGDNLQCRVEQGYDMQGNVIKMAKAFCAKCHFVIR